MKFKHKIVSKKTNQNFSILSKKISMILFLTGLITAFPVQAADYSCSDLNNPEKLPGIIMTVLEEQIGTNTSKDYGDAVVKDCLRITTCELKDNTTTCNSTYGELNACTLDSNTSCQRVQAFFAQSGTGLLYAYIGVVYRWAAGIIGIVSVLFLIVGGIQIATAGGDDSKIGEAKDRIIQSIAGLILLFTSALILYTINPNFFKP